MLSTVYPSIHPFIKQTQNSYSVLGRSCIKLWAAKRILATNSRRGSRQTKRAD